VTRDVRIAERSACGPESAEYLGSCVYEKLRTRILILERQFFYQQSVLKTVNNFGCVLAVKCNRRYFVRLYQRRSLEFDCSLITAMQCAACCLFWLLHRAVYCLRLEADFLFQFTLTSFPTYILCYPTVFFSFSSFLCLHCKFLSIVYRLQNYTVWSKELHLFISSITLFTVTNCHYFS